MSESYHDVAIAGGGPAGATAGLILARRGVDVCIIDKKVFPRPKLCGGLLTQKAVFALERLSGESRKELTARGIINSFSNSYEAFYRDKRIMRGQYGYPFHFVDRQVLDAFLLEQARLAGATVLEGVAVTGCDPGLAQVQCADGRRLKAAYVLGADGVNSVVRKNFNVDKKAWRHNLAATVEIDVDPMRMPEPVSHPMLYAGFIDTGYGWVFPHKDKVLIGMGGLIRSTKNLADSFRVFLLHLGVPAPEGPFKGNLMPYGNFLEKPVLGRTILAGDAGGFVEPLFGEGIYYALTTGEAAGEAALAGLTRSGDLEKTYMEYLNREVYPEMVWAGHLRRLAHFWDRYGGALPIALFAKALSPILMDAIHGVRSYKWLKKKEVRQSK